MPPSGWHDQTRDSGHDEMQIAVFEFLKKSFDPAWVDPRVFMEVPLVIRTRAGDRITGFADLAVSYSEGTRDTNRWRLFELKPRIYSIGALIRQVRAIRHAGQASFPMASVHVSAVVFKHDPLADQLIGVAQIPVLLWDVEAGKFVDQAAPQ